MSEIRAEKLQRIARDIPAAEVCGDVDAATLVLSWGSTYGAVRAATDEIRRRGGKVATTHIRHLSPLPANLGDVVRGYATVIVPELNMGQLANVLRSQYGVPIKSIAKIQGQPFKVSELVARITEALNAGSEQ